MQDASLVARKHQLRLPPQRLAEATPRAFWLSKGTPLEQAMAAPLAEFGEIPAYVSEGRWVVVCPDCGGAQLAARDDRRFMCNECANIGIAGMWRPVVWPESADDGEQVLAERGDVRNQNWLPGESVEQLVAENVAQGPAVAAPTAGPFADRWAGHAHDWPSAAEADGMVTCRGCQLVLPHDVVFETQEG